MLTRSARRGANAVEFAMTLPVLVTIMMGMMDYSWFFQQQHVVSAAAREGARAGAVAGPDDDPDALARSAAYAALSRAGVTTSGISITSETSGADPDVFVTVAVAVPYGGLTGLVPVPEAVRASAAARMEQP